MMQFMRAVPRHVAVGGLIVLAGATGACALVTWYVRYSSVFSHGSDSDVSNEMGALIATAGVLLGFITLIIAALGVAMVVLQRGVVAARAAEHTYFAVCRRAPDGTWSASSPDVPGVGVAGCATRTEAQRALELAIERHTTAAAP